LVLESKQNNLGAPIHIKFQLEALFLITRFFHFFTKRKHNLQGFLCAFQFLKNEDQLILIEISLQLSVFLLLLHLSSCILDLLSMTKRGFYLPFRKAKFSQFLSYFKRILVHVMIKNLWSLDLFSLQQHYDSAYSSLT